MGRLGKPEVKAREPIILSDYTSCAVAHLELGQPDAGSEQAALMRRATTSPRTMEQLHPQRGAVGQGPDRLGSALPVRLAIWGVT